MMNSDVRFHCFGRKEELVEALSSQIVKNLQDAIRENGKASLLVSGGSTPKPLFEHLRHSTLAWEKVSVGLVDERWVSLEHHDSNERFVKTVLLQDKAALATFVSMYHDKVEAKDAEGLCSEKVRTSLYPFDVLVLGMGTDAHTASLFPNNPKLEQGFDLENEALCIAIEPEDAPHKRMSLTRTAILSAKHLYLHFEGKEKLAVYKEAIAGEDSYVMPIRSILHQEKKLLEVYCA